MDLKWWTFNFPNTCILPIHFSYNFYKLILSFFKIKQYQSIRDTSDGLKLCFWSSNLSKHWCRLQYSETRFYFQEIWLWQPSWLPNVTFCNWFFCGRKQHSWFHKNCFSNQEEYRPLINRNLCAVYGVISSVICGAISMCKSYKES